MTDNVVPLGGVTKLDIPAERVIDGARGANMQNVVVVGYDHNGDFYFASSMADGGDVVWLLELAKRRLFEMADDLSGTE